MYFVNMYLLFKALGFEYLWPEISSFRNYTTLFIPLSFRNLQFSKVARNNVNVHVPDMFKKID